MTSKGHTAVWEVKVEKPSQWLTLGHCFSIISGIQRKTMAKPLLSHLLWGSAIAIITPMIQASTCGWVGSGPRHMIRVTLFCTLCEWFSHGRRFFDSRNVQKRATKSDTSGHCLWLSPGPWPDSKCSKTVEVARNKTPLSARDYNWRNPRKI